MKNLYNTLIVGDPGLIIKGITSILNEITQSAGVSFEKYFAANYVDVISRLERSPPIELVFLEMLQSLEWNIGGFSSEEIGVEIRKLYPDILIVVVMAHSIPVRIKSIHSRIKPDGFFLLGDIGHLNIASAYMRVLKDPPFYSRSISLSLIDFGAIKFIPDEIDIQLLKELDKGLVMKEIAYRLSLSRVTIVNRKQKLKLQFGVEYGNDRDLINKARKLGFI